MEEDAMRSILEDPITLDLMEDAMVAPCGHSFSQASIERWVRDDAKHFCPLCKQPLTIDQLHANYALRDAIDKYKAAHGEPATDRRGLNISKPIEKWTVAETQKWIDNFSDWVEDSVLVDEHKIDGQTLARMTEDELKDKLNVSDDNVGALLEKIARVKTISEQMNNVDKMPPVVMNKTPTSGSSGAVDIEAGVGSGHQHDQGCLSRHISDARASDYGCCIFECERCFLCECSASWYDCCKYKNVYRPPAALFCEHCGGKKATYGRRTFWGICFIPFVMIIALLLFVEAAFWALVIMVALVCLICVLAIAIAASSN